MEGEPVFLAQLEMKLALEQYLNVIRLSVQLMKCVYTDLICIRYFDNIIVVPLCTIACEGFGNFKIKLACMKHYTGTAK